MNDTIANKPRGDVAARQDPLRAHYKKAPADALITDRGRTVSTHLDDPLHGWAAPGSQNHGVQWKLGLHRAVAGLHDAPNPGDLLCQALACCMDSVLRMIANRHGVKLHRLEVDVEGDVDVRGTLWVSQEVPVGFQQLRCRVRIEPEPGTDPALMQRLVGAAERSCINLATLRKGVPVEMNCEAVPEHMARA